MWLLLGLAAAVLIADIVSKVVVVATIRQGENIRTLGGVLYLTDLRNSGAAFSFAQGATILFTVIALAVVVVIVRTSRRLYSALWATALGLVLGGAVGNLVDRVMSGSVTDFIDVYVGTYHWPTFNTADSAITIGIVLLAFDALFGRRAAQTVES